MGVEKVASVGGNVGKGLISKIFRIKLSYYFIIFLFIQAIAVGIQRGGGFQIVYSLGERFFNMFQDLQSNSLLVIERGGSFHSIWDFIKISWSFLSNIWLIYLWLKLFVWIYGKSPFSNESEGFKNISFALITLYLFQVFYLFFMYFMGANFLNGFGFFDIIQLPYTSFRDFIKSIIILFSSIHFESIWGFG